MENETKTIKLSPEQIAEREFQLEQTKLQLAQTEFNAKQLSEVIESNFPIRQAKVELAKMQKQIDTMKHNVIALTQQIEKGEM